MNRIVADELAQLRQRRRQFGSGLLKIGLEIRPQCREVAALGAFGTPQLQLDERYLVFNLQGVQTRRASSRALFTRWTEPALISVNTRSPAASSRILPKGALALGRQRSR